MTPELWNWIDIAILLVVSGYCIAHYCTHVDGDRNLHLWSAFVLLVTAALRLALAFEYISQYRFTVLIRPWIGLVYMIPALHAYIEWKTDRKNGGI